jgi:hypothetical protein
MVNFEIAKKYLDLGWSIMPIHLSWDKEKQKFNKKPTVDWKDYQSRLPTEEELHFWFDDGKVNGIGLITGKLSGIVVVDVEKDGLELMQELHLDSPRVSKTISGGRHPFFKWNKEIGNTVRIGGKQMDFRGDGGFVVLPPSSCEHDGETYHYSWEKEGDNLPILPKTVFGDWIEVKEPIKLSEFTNKEIGSRDSDLHRVACSLLRKYPEEEAWLLVNDINRTYNPPLSDQVVKEKFASAQKFIKEQGEKESWGEKEENNSPMVGKPILWARITASSEKTEWIWENYLAKRRVTLFSALPKAGKSTFLRSLFLAINREEEFVGQPTKKCNILVLSEESDEEWADSREGVEDEDLGKTYVWIRPTRSIPNSKGWEKNIDEISLACKELKIDLVVLDTITTFWSVEDENDASKVKRALVPLFKLTEDDGVALMLVHHFRKSGGNEGTAARGSGALAGYVDVLMELRRHEDGMPNQRKIKTSGRGVQETELVIELMDDGTYKTLGEPWIVSKTARLTKIISIMEEFKRPVSTKEISNFWNANVCKMDERTIRRYMKELEKNGQVTVDRIDIVLRSKVPFYACTGWKMAEKAMNGQTSLPIERDLSVHIVEAKKEDERTVRTDNRGEKKPTFQTSKKAIVRSSVRSSSPSEAKSSKKYERTSTSLTGEHIVRGQDYGTKTEGIPFDEDDEEIPF